jgi:hypothetical protein
LLRFQLWTIFGYGPGSGSIQYLAQFSKNEKITQKLALSMSEASYFTERCLSFLIFLTFYYILCCIRIQIRIRSRTRNAFFTKPRSYGSAIPVLAPQHCFHMRAPIRTWIFYFYINAELKIKSLLKEDHIVNGISTGTLRG